MSSAASIDDTTRLAGRSFQRTWRADPHLH
jgi:hypothetical protein